MGGLTTAEPGITLAFSQAHEFEVACDYGDPYHTWPGPHDDPARWIAFFRCPACNHAPTRLLCDRCKENVLTTDGGCSCEKCEERIVPYRHAVERIEPFDKRAT